MDSDFVNAGMVPPKRTFLDRSAPPKRGGSLPAPARPSTSGGNIYGGMEPAPPNVAAINAATTSNAPADTKAAILAENRVEILDMLSESVATLKNVYRSKFVLGDHLRMVDPSYSGDTANRFDLTIPPPFDAAFGMKESADDAPPSPSTSAAQAANEKLRAAEELIKKLFRRNTQLETETKYLKVELFRLERLQGLSRGQTHNLVAEDGHVPLQHPLYSKKMVRRCRSIPPQRTMLRTAVGGFGLTFPARPGSKEQEPTQSPPDPAPVAMLKKHVLQLTEALVAVQHDNEQLVQERTARLTMRDGLMKQYIREHDANVARLHRLLQDLVTKVQNPMRLMRAKQPSAGMSPVVVAQNILKEVSATLSDQIASLTGDIVKDSTAALPPPGSLIPVTGAADPSGPLSPRGPGVGRGSTTPSNAAKPGGAIAMLEASVAVPFSDDDPSGVARRKDLARRIRLLCDQLPVNKRKQLLLLFLELKALYTSLCQSNSTLLEYVDASRQRFNKDLVSLKVEIALLKDALRAAGVDDASIQRLVAAHR